MTGPWRAVALCWLLVLSAGCAGLVGGPGADGTPADGPGAAYTGELNVTAIQAAHEAALREAGSYALRTNETLVGASPTGSVSRVSVTRVGASGAISRTVRQPPGTNRTVYVAPDGTAYERVDSRPYGTLEYREPAVTPNASSALAAEVLALLPEIDPQHATGTVDGRTLHVYTAEGVDSVPAGAGQGLDNVTGFRLRLAVFEGGHVRSLSYEVTARRDGERIRLRRSTEIRSLGDVSVAEPAWLPEAREAIERRRAAATPTPGGSETLSETLSATLSAPRTVVEADVPRPVPAGADVRIADVSEVYDGEGLRAAQVGFLGRVIWPEEATAVRIDAAYDPAELPAGYAEENVTLARFDRELGTFVRVRSARVDTEANTVSAAVPTEHRGDVFVVMNVRRFADFLR